MTPPRRRATLGVVTWIPVPPIPLARASSRLAEGYAACPETGEIRGPSGQVLAARRAGPRALGIHAWAELPGGRRARTSASPARLVALALLRAGLVDPPPPETHGELARLVDPGQPPRLANLTWVGRRGAADLPLRLTPAGRDLLDPARQPGGRLHGRAA